MKRAAAVLLAALALVIATNTPPAEQTATGTTTGLVDGH
jgi:hypothetical protein